MASLGNQEGTHVMKMITFSNKNSILFHSNLNIKIPFGRMKILSITMIKRNRNQMVYQSIFIENHQIR